MARAGVVWVDVKADTSGFVRSVKAAGNEADKTLTKASSRLDEAGKKLTRFGTVGLAAGGIAAVGLYKLASAAGDLNESLSATGVIFGDATKQIDAFGEKAAETAGMSKKAAVDGANTFGTFGKAAGLAGDDLATFSTELVQLAGDLASFKNTTPEEAIEAIGAALRGESEPLRRYGVLLDDATLKNKALEMGIYNGTGTLTSQQKILSAQKVIFEQTNDAQGDYMRTSDSFANQQRSLQADLENLKAEVGAGLLPMFSSLTKKAGDVIGAFNKLPDPVKETIGAVAGIGTAGLLAASGLSLVVGQGIKMRDNFGAVSSKLRDAEGNLTGLGRAAKGLSIGFAALGVIEGMDAARRAIVDDSERAATALKKLQIASGDSTQEIIRQFSEFAGAQDDEFFSEIVEVFGKNISLLPGVAEETIEDLEAAFESMDLGDQQKTVDAFKAYRSGLDDSSQAAKDYDNLLENLGGRLDLNKEAQEAATDAAAEGADAQERLSEKVGNTGEGYKTALEAQQAFTDALRAQSDPLFAVQDATDDLAEKQAELAEVQKEHGKSSPEYASALRDVATAGFDLDAAIADVNATLKDNPAAAKATVDMLAQLRDDGVLSQEEFNRLTGSILTTIATAKIRQPFDVPVDATLSNLMQVDRVLNGIMQKTIIWRGMVQPATVPKGPVLPGQSLAPLGPVPPKRKRAAGGIEFPKAATIFRNSKDGVIQGAEGRTGYEEAWIPTDPQYRDRAVDVWGRTGQKLGVLPMAAGGLIDGHTREEWLNLERAQNGGHTLEEWANLADAIKEQTKAQEEAAEEQADRDREALAVQTELADGAWTIAKFEAEQTGDFARQLQLLTDRQAGLVAYTSEWVRLELEIRRTRADQAKAAEPVRESRGGTATLERNVTNIENLNITSPEPPRAWLDAGVWRHQNPPRV